MINLDFLAAKKEFFAGLLVVALAGLAVSMPALAQDEDEDDMDLEAIDEVVVTGIRSSLRSNLDAKRFADSISDSINAEDIGKFPDKNVADALQRVPGVSITRSGGEGQRVDVRGLGSDLTLTQLNGNYIASSLGEPQRSFLYTLLPSNMIARAEVIKSPQARIDEGGVGGTIILHTHKPLDRDANSGFVAAEVTYADVTEDYEPQFSASYSWKNDSDTFGVLVGYTQQNRENRTVGATTESWNYVATEDDFNALIASGALREGTQRRDPLVDDGGNGATFDGFYMPTAVVGVIEEQQREREGIQFSAQWRPTEAFEIGLDYFRFELGGDFERYRLVLPEWNLGNAIAPGGVTLDADGDTLVGLRTVAPDGVRLSSPQYAGDRVRRVSTSDTYTLNAAFDFGGFSMDAIVGRTDAEGGDEEQFFSAIYSTNQWDGDNPVVNSIGDWAWQFNGNEGITITSSDDFASLGNRPDAIALDNYTSSFADSTDEETYAQLDFEFPMAWGAVTSLQAGVKYRQHEISRRVRDVRYDDASDPADCSRFIPWDPPGTPCPSWIGTGNFVSDLSLHPDGNTIANEFIAGSPMDNIVGDALNIASFSVFDWDSYRGWLQGRFGDPTVTTQPFNIYEVSEDISAAYVQANFSTDRLRGNIGLRYVETDLETLVFNRTSAPGAGDEFVTRAGKTDNTLPSLNVVYDVNDDLLLRFAASKVMARIPYGNLGGAEILIFTPASDDGSTPEEWRGSGGNPELEPYEATAFDLSLEWYYADASAAGIAIYRKDVDNFVTNAAITVQREVDGEIVTIDPYTTSVNGSDVTQDGVELFVQHAFDNGFGLIANYTYNDSEQTQVSFEGAVIGATSVAGVAEDQMNLVGYYENDRFSIRASYNRIGDRPLGVSRGLEVIAEEYDQIDINATYNFSENLNATLAVINLTEEIQRTYLDDTNRPAGVVYPGRRAYIGVNYTF